MINVPLTKSFKYPKDNLHNSYVVQTQPVKSKNNKIEAGKDLGK